MCKCLVSRVYYICTGFVHRHKFAEGKKKKRKKRRKRHRAVRSKRLVKRQLCNSGSVVKTAVKRLKNERGIVFTTFHNLCTAGSQNFTYPLSSSCSFSLLLVLPKGLCLSNYHRNVEPGPWSPHTEQHSAPLSTCLPLPAQGKSQAQSKWTVQQKHWSTLETC